MASTDPDTPKRCRECGVVTLGTPVVIRLKDGSAYPSGLKTCGSVPWCAVCSAKVRQRRADELAAAIAVWCSRGHSVSFLTLTNPHDLADPLARLLAAQADGWRRIVNGAPWTRLKRAHGIAGWCSAIEITHGFDHGWHPHRHLLLFHFRELDAAGMAAVSAHIRPRWSAASLAAGLREPDLVHGVDLRFNCDSGEVGRYLSKVQEGDWGAAQEVTLGDLKGGRKGNRVPFEILEDYQATGDVTDRDLWREYVAATRGLAMLRWSRGLRADLLPGAGPEKSDAELAAADVRGEAVAVVPVPVWRRVIMARLEIGMMEAAEHGGLDAVNVLLAAHGCGWALAPG